MLRTMEKFQRYLERDPDIGYSFSLADILRAVNMVFHELEPKWGVIPNSWADVGGLFFIFFSGSPPTETAKYVDPELHDGARHVLRQEPQGRQHPRASSSAARSSSPRTRWRRPTFKLAGGLIGVLAAANEELVRNDLLMNFLGFFTIYVIMLFTYRSLLAGSTCSAPLICSNIIDQRVHGGERHRHQHQHLPLVTVGVGFGIDYGLYIVSRIIEEIQRQRRPRRVGARGAGDLRARR